MPEQISEPIGTAGGRGLSREQMQLALVAVFVATGALVLRTGSGAAAVAWAAVWGSLFIVLRSGTILLLMASLVVFFQQSVWYMGSEASPTLYELEVGHVKPIDILVLAAALSWLLRAESPFRLEKVMRRLWFGWVVVSVIGIIVGYSRGIPWADILVISEFRNLWYAAALMPTVLRGVKEIGLPRLCRAFLLFASVKAAIALASVALNSVIIWPTAASAYAGGRAAVYGGDDDVAVVLFAVIVGLGWLSQRRNTAGLKGDARILTWFGISICALSALLSFRRGAALTLVVAGIVFSFLAGRKVALKWFLVALFSLVGLFTVVTFYPSVVPEPAMTLWARISGTDERAVMSDVGRWFDVKDGLEVAMEHPVFGLGAGGRVRAQRLMRYHLDPDSILVHQAVIHTWLKYGLLGIAWYLCTFGGPFLTLIRRRRALRMAPGGLITLAIGGFLVGSLIWEQFTPPFFQNFRATFLVLLATVIIAVVSKETVDLLAAEQSIDSRRAHQN